jgi:hypothetical protein
MARLGVAQSTSSERPTRQSFSKSRMTGSTSHTSPKSAPKRSSARSSYSCRRPTNRRLRPRRIAESQTDRAAGSEPHSSADWQRSAVREALDSRRLLPGSAATLGPLFGAACVDANPPHLAGAAARATSHRKATTRRIRAEVIAFPASGGRRVVFRPIAAILRVTRLTLTHLSVADTLARLRWRMKLTAAK